MANFLYSECSSAIICLLLLSATLLLKAFYNVYLHPLRSYKGPKLWAASRIPWAVSMHSGHLHQRLHELHSRYGPIVRIAPNELSYISAPAWHDIYQQRAGHRVIPKNGVWGRQPKGAPHSVLTIDEAAHTRNRRALMGAFTEHAIAEHASVLEDHVRLMISQFRERVAAGEGKTVVDIVDWLNFLTFDISGALSFGSSFDSVKNGKAHPWVDISCSFGKGLALVAAVNFFRPLDSILAYTIPKSVRQKMEYHRQLVHEKLQQRLAMPEKSESQDYVGSVLKYNEVKGETRVPMDELESNLNVLIFAGSETTGTALASILTALLAHPAELQKVTSEVRAAFHNEDEITVASVPKLDYLTAVIQEGIRLGPPAAIALPRVVPKGGSTICGRHVPQGTFVSVNQYPAYRSALNFTSPTAFLPSRFTPRTPFPSDDLSAFHPFLLGRHMCLGQKLAWAEMRLALAHLLFAFDVAPAEPVRDFGMQNTYIFWEKRPLRIELR